MKKLLTIVFVLCICLCICACNGDVLQSTTPIQQEGDNTSDHTHNFGNWKIDKVATCTSEGDEKRTCECGAFETRTISHTGHTEVVDKAVNATCTQSGLTEGKHCSVCNEVIVAQNTINAKGHSEVVDKAVAATCTQSGLTEGKHCSACNEIIVAQQTVEKTQHQVINVSGKKPTATVSGYTDGSKCSVCGTTIQKQKTLVSLKEYVQTNPTQVNGSEYTLYILAQQLAPYMDSDYLLQIKASGTTVTVTLLKGTTYAVSTTLNSVNSTTLEYTFGYFVDVYGTQYYDAMRGYYPTYDLFILEKLDYIETSSTIGNREPYKTERFEGHRETACEMAKDAILLLDTFLYKYGFGYSTADLGFCIG